MKIIILMIFCSLLTACTHDPVDEDYYNDLDKIQGGEAPEEPQIDTVNSTICENKITIYSTKSTDPEGEEVVYNLYATDKDTGSFSGSDYYDSEYFQRQFEVTPDPPNDPFVYEFYINPAFTGTVYIWITAFDGGRESYKSNIADFDVPGGSCP